MKIAAVCAVLIGSLATTAAGPARAQAACPAWDGGQPPDHNWAILSAVTVLPTCQAWAVGQTPTRSPEGMLIEEFNGTSWVRQAIPAVSGRTELAGVAATSVDNAWAVGSAHLGGASVQALIINWNGGTWATQAAPALPPDATSGELAGVAASSAGNAWAVGSFGVRKVHQTLILHWDGAAWSRIPSPDPGGQEHGSFLTSVAVLSPKNAWAAGYYNSAKFKGSRTLILHWNGKTWSQIASPNPDPVQQGQLYGITITSPRNAWAVGYNAVPNPAGPTGTPIILHWNGRTWSPQASQYPSSPNVPPLRRLLSVSAISATNAWATGYQALGTDKTLILHWDGHSWQWTRGYDNADAIFSYGVAASATGGVWVVGDGDNLVPGNRSPQAPLTMRWTGQTWQG